MKTKIPRSGFALALQGSPPGITEGNPNILFIQTFNLVTPWRDPTLFVLICNGDMPWHVPTIPQQDENKNTAKRFCFGFARLPPGDHRR